MRLASDGYALKYKSVETSKIPGWAVWDDQAYGTTFEPAAIVYNKRLVDAKEVPQTHADFAKLITQPKFKDKVTTYDIEKSGVGFMFMTQDSARNTRSSWDLENAFGVAKVRVQSSTGTMLERISSGENLIGYNVLGSYALVRAKTDPSMGVVHAEGLHADSVARDVHQQGRQERQRRQAVAGLHAYPHRGQTIIANDSKLFAIRADVKGETTSADLIKHDRQGQRQASAGTPLSLLQFLGPGQAHGLPQAVERNRRQEVNLINHPTARA